MRTSSQSDVSKPSTKAVVLGGGGAVGRAWETGLATGLSALGIDLGHADLIIGTSAGATVGAQLALGLDVEPVVDSATGPAPYPTSSSGLQQVMAVCARAITSSTPEVEWEQVGRVALAADTASEEANLARTTFAAVTGHGWPSNFWATAVSTRTGRFQVWNAASEVPLERAVASSGALPGVFPPITIGDDRYMDGGVRSMLNSDLAAGYASVVVVSCFALTAPQDSNDTTTTLNRALVDEFESLRRSGSAVEVVTPDEAFLALTKKGTMMLNTSLVPDAYELGKRQALSVADRIHRLWAVKA
ncbi:hypothetical protein MMC28_010599 [Mycoblastus sanguinarius]|nr:hypothetical protein [Mycoblastus sanguinarius]